MIECRACLVTVQTTLQTTVKTTVKRIPPRLPGLPGGTVPAREFLRRSALALAAATKENTVLRQGPYSGRFLMSLIAGIDHPQNPYERLPLIGYLETGCRIDVRPDSV